MKTIYDLYEIMKDECIVSNGEEFSREWMGRNKRFAHRKDIFVDAADLSAIQSRLNKEYTKTHAFIADAIAAIIANRNKKREETIN